MKSEEFASALDMQSEKQYIELYKQARTMIHEHSSDVMNSERDEALNALQRMVSPPGKLSATNTLIFKSSLLQIMV